MASVDIAFKCGICNSEIGDCRQSSDFRTVTMELTCTECQRALDEKDDAISDMESRLSDDEEIPSLKGRIKELEAEVSKLQTELSDEEERASNLDDRVHDLLKENAKEVSERAWLGVRVETLENKLKELGESA